MEMYLNDETINRMAYEGNTEAALERALFAASHDGGVTSCYLRYLADRDWDLLCGDVERALEVLKSWEPEAARDVVASAILIRNGDGRFYATVKEWAFSVFKGRKIPQFRLPLHSCHLNKIALDLFVRPGQNVNAYL